MRILAEVIEQILEIIPETETGFRSEFADLLSSEQFLSLPEMQHERWTRGGVIMARHISQNENDWNDWELEVVKIWMGPGNLHGEAVLDEDSPPLFQG